MSSNRNKVVGLLMRAMAVLVAGIMFSIAFLASANTYSWFTSFATGTEKVAASETFDLLGNVELLSDGEDNNLTAIKIRKADDISYDPLIYFSVEGEAANYVNHINPVRLEDNIDYIVPVVTDVNLNQFAMLADREENVSGKLRIKYLNEFIDEAYDISFSTKYLTNRLMKKIVNEGAKPEIVNSKTMRMAASSEPPKSDKENSRAQDTRALTIKAIEALTELVEWKGIDAISEDGKISEESLLSIGLKLTSDQEFLLDIMYPGLKAYAEGLKSYIGKLKAEIEDNNALLASLDEKLLSLEGEYYRLLEENARLTEQINSMTPVQPPNQPPAAGDTGTGDTGAGDTGTEDTGAGDTEEVNTGEGGTEEVDTGEGGTEEVDTGEGDTEEVDTGEEDTEEVDTGEEDTEEVDTGEEDTEEVDTGEDDTEEVDTGEGDTEEIDTGEGDTEEGDTEEGDTEEGDTEDEGESDGSDSTDSNSEIKDSIISE